MNKRKDMKTVVYQPDPTHYRPIAAISSLAGEGVCVELCKHSLSGTAVDVKKIDLENENIVVSEIQNEILVNQLLNHHNVSKILKCFTVNNQLWVVQPNHAYGTCCDLLNNYPTGLPEHAIAHILRDVLTALDYIHSMGYVHRAIKTENVSVDHTGSACVTGLTQTISLVNEGRRLKALHNFPIAADNLICLAPEILEQNLAGYGLNSDIYSVGILACELANGSVPFSDQPPTLMLLEKVNNLNPRLIDSVTLSQITAASSSTDVDGTPSGFTVDDLMALCGVRDIAVMNVYQTKTFSHSFHQFVELCFMPAHSRPSSNVLLNHSFFKQVRRRSVGGYLFDILTKARPVAAVIAESTTVDEEVECDIENTRQKLSNISTTEHWNF